MRIQNQLLKEASSVCMLVEVIARASQNMLCRLTLDVIPTSDRALENDLWISFMNY